MRVDVLGTADRRLIADVGRLARRAGRDRGAGRSTVNVVFVDDNYIRALNRRYRRRDRATDVLSFNLPGPGSLLGEVYVSRGRARAQARAYGVSYASELRRLALHGLLHLLGLTHRQMARYQQRYLGAP